MLDLALALHLDEWPLYHAAWAAVASIGGPHCLRVVCPCPKDDPSWVLMHLVTGEPTAAQPQCDVNLSGPARPLRARGVPAGCWILACSSAPARDPAALVLRPSPSSRLAPRSPRLGVFHGPTPRAISKLDTLNHTKKGRKRSRERLALPPCPLSGQNNSLRDQVWAFGSLCWGTYPKFRKM